MQLRFGFIAALSVLSLAGCSSLAINNGSLDYKDAATFSTTSILQKVLWFDLQHRCILHQALTL